jgi:hypothetical protein
MNPTTKTVLIAAGATLVAFIVVDTFLGANTQGADGAPSISTSVKYTVAVGTAGATAAWLWYLAALLV